MGKRLTIVLLGHTGEGKSATGNTILRLKAFESRRSFKSVTQEISEAAENVFDIQVSVVDTPGILCPGWEEKIRAHCQTIGSPCLFLVVVKLDRFTEESQRAVDAALRVVGERQAYLLFTCGDALEKSLEEFIGEDNESPLPKLVEKFQERHVVFNNRHGGTQQVRELLESSGHLAEVSGGREQRNVVLLGMCGAGKSSSGNTLLGCARFISRSGFDAVTADCERASAVVEGRQLLVVDTPGLNDSSVSSEIITENIFKALQETGPEIHTFVIVVKIDRVCEAECGLIHSLPKLFGEEAARYCMVLFTHGDQSESESIDDLIKRSRFASELVNMCAGRYCVFNNKQTDQRQVQHFLHQVDKIVFANSGEPCLFVSLDQTLNTGEPRCSVGLSLDQTLNTGEPHCSSALSLWIMFKSAFIKLIEWIRSLFHKTPSSSVPYSQLL